VFGTGGEAHTTNQRMEIMAVLEALRSNPGQVTIVSDSTYVVNCFNKKWWRGWRNNGWLNAARKPVANKDLWEHLIELYLERGGEATIKFEWVKGHSGDFMNDLVDRLAVEAAAAAR
jgi:ribonuclease HI